MKILNFNKFLENKTINKEELIDKIKFYSSYIENYMKDYNKYTTSNLNLSFSFYKLEIKQIFKSTNELDYNSNDGIIKAICNEFIKWGERFTYDNKGRRDIGYKFDYYYNNYTDAYKLNNKRGLYKQDILNDNYFYISHKLGELIKGTIWDIPNITDFTEDDKDIIINCIINEFDVNIDKINIKFIDNILKIEGLNNSEIKYNTDFIDRLQYYFKGLIILEVWNRTRIYLPFKK